MICRIELRSDTLGRSSQVAGAIFLYSKHRSVSREVIAQRNVLEHPLMRLRRLRRNGLVIEFLHLPRAAGFGPCSSMMWIKNAY